MIPNGIIKIKNEQIGKFLSAVLINQHHNNDTDRLLQPWIVMEGTEFHLRNIDPVMLDADLLDTYVDADLRKEFVESLPENVVLDWLYRLPSNILLHGDEFEKLKGAVRKLKELLLSHTLIKLREIFKTLQPVVYYALYPDETLVYNSPQEYEALNLTVHLSKYDRLQLSVEGKLLISHLIDYSKMEIVWLLKTNAVMSIIYDIGQINLIESIALRNSIFVGVAKCLRDFRGILMINDEILSSWSLVAHGASMSEPDDGAIMNLCCALAVPREILFEKAVENIDSQTSYNLHVLAKYWPKLIGLDSNSILKLFRMKNGEKGDCKTGYAKTCLEYLILTNYDDIFKLLIRSNNILVDLSGISMNSEGWKGLRNVLQLQSSVNTLKISQSNLDDDRFKILMEGVKSSSLTSIDISYNNIRDFGVSHLWNCKMQLHESRCETVYGSDILLRHHGIQNNDPDSDSQFTHIWNMDTCETLSAEYHSTFHKQTLETSSDVESVSTTKYSIDMHADSQLPPLLSLEYIDISYNPIDQQGYKAFANMLYYSKFIKLINLAGCGIGDEGLNIFLCAIIRPLDHLETLGISKNKISDKGIQDLVKFLVKNRSLESIDLSWNKITDSGVGQLKIELGATLRSVSIDLQGNEDVRDEAIMEFQSLRTRRSTEIKPICETSSSSVKKVVLVLQGCYDKALSYVNELHKQLTQYHPEGLPHYIDIFCGSGGAASIALKLASIKTLNTVVDSLDNGTKGVEDLVHLTANFIGLYGYRGKLMVANRAEALLNPVEKNISLDELENRFKSSISYDPIEYGLNLSNDLFQSNQSDYKDTIVISIGISNNSGAIHQQMLSKLSKAVYISQNVGTENSIQLISSALRKNLNEDIYQPLHGSPAIPSEDFCCSHFLCVPWSVYGKRSS